jgi:hypothetical protein
LIPTLIGQAAAGSSPPSSAGGECVFPTWASTGCFISNSIQLFLTVTKQFPCQRARILQKGQEYFRRAKTFIQPVFLDMSNYTDVEVILNSSPKSRMAGIGQMLTRAKSVFCIALHNAKATKYFAKCNREMHMAAPRIPGYPAPVMKRGPHARIPDLRLWPAAFLC